MVSFKCDYAEGAHPKVLEALVKTNLEQTAGYGEDVYCGRARELIRSLCGAPEAEVHFLVGGTQTNTVAVSALLRPHQGVLCADTGHINVHETGAIEATGHKVLPLHSSDGKLSAAQVREAHAAHWGDANHEHLVQPGMVYISHPTENGTIYTLGELRELSEACRELGLPLYLDGARLACGLAASRDGLTLKEIARLCDIFYIGGTKCGALFGEAVVIPAPALARDFRYLMKRQGGMLAKGRLLGLQFCALLEDGLYFELGAHAVKQALRIREGFERRGFAMLFDSPTNQQFPVLPDALAASLSERWAFELWERLDETRAAWRFCASWAAKSEAVDELLREIEQL